jgi:hypothetical protein
VKSQSQYNVHNNITLSTPFMSSLIRTHVCEVKSTPSKRNYRRMAVVECLYTARFPCHNLFLSEGFLSRSSMKAALLYTSLIVRGRGRRIDIAIATRTAQPRTEADVLALWRSNKW